MLEPKLSKTELSTKAKTGIVVDAAITRLTVIAISIFLWRRNCSEKIGPSDFDHLPGQHTCCSPLPPEYLRTEKPKYRRRSGTQEMYTAPEAQDLPATHDPLPK